MQRFLAGGLAGAISRTTVAPLERIRTMVRQSVSDLADYYIGAGMHSVWLHICDVLPRLPRVVQPWG